MSWKPIDFQGIVTLDTPFVDYLNQHLEEQESQLAHRIIQAIPLSLTDPGQSLPPPVPRVLLRLPEALDVFQKLKYQNSDRQQTHIAPTEYSHAAKKINSALEEYVEMLEGSVTELFQQLNELGIDQWHMRLAHVIGSVKDILIHKCEDLIWGIRRLETQLKKCLVATESPAGFQGLWFKVSNKWKSPIDHSLISRLQHCEERLKAQYQRFMQHYRGFLELQDQVEKQMASLSDFYVLTTVDRETQKQFLQLFQLLKLWDLNRTRKALPNNEFVRALRNVFTMDKAHTVFKDYYKALKQSLFEKSLYIKKHANEWDENPANKTLMLELLGCCKAESRLLESTASKYREFLLTTNQEPFPRSRIGFSKMLVGPEPYQTKPLLQLSHDLDQLSQLFTRLESSVLDKHMPEDERNQIEREIDQIIFEFGHPLASNAVTQRLAENLLNKIEKLDELGTRDNDTIYFIGDTLLMMLRADWRRNVLFGIPKFHQIYDIHHNLTQPAKNRQHLTRINKFQHLTKQILDWVHAHRIEARAHDIELDINDMKVYLQDFLAYIQRNLLDISMTRERAHALQSEISQELLECRYLFGNFFYKLRQHGAEGIMIRKHCLFIDNYLEAIEQRLYDLQNASWPEVTLQRDESDSVNEEDE